MTVEGVGPSLAVVDATIQVIFEFYVEQVLAPTLESGQIVVLDNLAAHKSLRAKELIEGRGCELMSLPPSEAPPELNPIEETFSKIKGILRRVEARTRETQIEAPGAAISALTPSDAPLASSSIAATDCPSTFYETCC